MKRIQKLNSFFQIFSSSSSFLPRFVKNVLKIGLKVFSQIFMKTATQPDFDMENSKIEISFSHLFIFIFIFVSICLKCPKNWVKSFFHRFS